MIVGGVAARRFRRDVPRQSPPDAPQPGRPSPTAPWPTPTTVEPVVTVPALLNGFAIVELAARRPDGDLVGLSDRAVLLHARSQGSRLGRPVRRRLAIAFSAAAALAAAAPLVSGPSSRVAWTLETVKLVQKRRRRQRQEAPRGLCPMPRRGRERGHPGCSGPGRPELSLHLQAAFRLQGRVPRQLHHERHRHDAVGSRHGGSRRLLRCAEAPAVNGENRRRRTPPR